MRHKKLILSTLLLLVLGLTRIQAQEAVPATGGNSSDSGNSVSYSVGQVIYSINSGFEGSEAQGVQQAYEISIDSEFVIDNTILVYPNPTGGSLILKFLIFNKSTFNYQLYDLNGRLLENNPIEKNETSIQMGYFAVTTYFLIVRDGKKEIKSFKIIKN